MSTRPFILTALLLSLYPTPPILGEPGAATEFSPEALIGDAKKSFMSVLTSELAAGPLNALNACKLKAPTIPKQFENAAIKLGRTSERLRNPANAPKEWMQKFLQEGKETTSDRPIKPVTITLDSGHKGYLEPIYVAPMCLVCHGNHIDAALAGKINELYPSDKAKGYSAKEFRGAFWVEWKP